MEITNERRKLLIQIADDIMLKLRNKGFTGKGFAGVKEDIDDKTWEDAFIKELHPLVDEAIAEYKLGGFDIFYMGVWFGMQPYS